MKYQTILHFLCSCSYLFTLQLSSQFYWHIRLKSTAYFFDQPCIYFISPYIVTSRVYGHNTIAILLVQHEHEIMRQLKRRRFIALFKWTESVTHAHTHTHTRLTALCPGLPRWAGTRKVKPIWILLQQETVSGSGISWAVCKSAPRSRQITTPAPHHSVLQAGCPSCRPTNSVKALKA